MKNKILKIISVGLCIASLVGCGTNNTATVNVQENVVGDVNSKTVIATTYAVYDWAKNVIGDSSGITLKYLVDSSVDLHSYQPSAEDILEYKSADLVLCIGGESEEWIEDMILDDEKVVPLMDSVTAKEEEIIEGMQGDEEEGEEPEYDKHIWLSLINAQACVKTISEKFSVIDNDNSDVYNKNADDYIKKLKSLDEEYRVATNGAACKTLLFGDRFPFRYMVDDYGLSYYAAFIGCSAESEASFETIAFLAEKVDELGLNTICVISDNHDIADAIIRATDTKDQTIVEFNSMQSISNKEADVLSYMDIMTDNLLALKTALGE